MSEMTERQAKAWPEAVAEAKLYGPGLSESQHRWDFTWADETRPGRGHDLSAIQCDGEHFAQITLDVYGSRTVSVAKTNWIHNSADEECDCAPCREEREVD